MYLIASKAGLVGEKREGRGERARLALRRTPRDYEETDSTICHMTFSCILQRPIVSA